MLPKDALLCNKCSTRDAGQIGWTNKPTPRSETARLMRNVFRRIGIDAVFLSACIVVMFNALAVYAKKTLAVFILEDVLKHPGA